MPTGARGEPALVLGQIHFHCPVSACEEVEDSDEAAHTAVGILLHFPVDRSRASGSMTNESKVELNASAGPGTTLGYVAELHGIIVVEQFASGLLVNHRPYLSSHFGQQLKSDIVVLQGHNSPLARSALTGETVVTIIRIDFSKRATGSGSL